MFDVNFTPRDQHADDTIAGHRPGFLERHGLLGTDATIASLRGRVHQYAGVPLVVTYHPAYLLRNPADKAKAWADLCLALQHAPQP